MSNLESANCRPKASDYQPVFNLCGQGDIETAKELTGREYIPTKYWLDTSPDSGTRKIMVRMYNSCSIVMHCM